MGRSFFFFFFSGKKAGKMAWKKCFFLSFKMVFLNICIYIYRVFIFILNKILGFSLF